MDAIRQPNPKEEELKQEVNSSSVGLFSSLTCGSIDRKIPKLQMELNTFLTQRLTAAAVEISAVFEKKIVEYQVEISRSKEENKRLQRLLDLVFHPEIKLRRAGL